MFSLVLTPDAPIEVRARKHVIAYATDGSAPNPLEATYAALAGCAGVYARKACREMGIDDAGIAIDMNVTVQPDRPLMPTKVGIEVAFPDRFTPDQRQAVLALIDQCAVKNMIRQGGGIEFSVFGAEQAA